MFIDDDPFQKKERAFDLAEEASYALHDNDIQKASKFSFKAIRLDPDSVDGWRNLINCMKSYCDEDTVICALRETIKFTRHIFDEIITNYPGCFWGISQTRPFIRLLLELANISYESGRLDIAIYTYEEIIRLNHSDNTGVRSALLACYFMAISRLRRDPSFRPVRTFQHAEALMNANLDDEDPLFESDNIVVRWANIVLAYERKENWQELCKKEYDKNPITFEVLFNEKALSDLEPEFSFGYVVGVPSEDVRQHGDSIKGMMNGWPELLIQIYQLIRGDVPNKFKDDVLKAFQNAIPDVSKETKENLKSTGEMLLENGRESLKNKEFSKAYLFFTLSKRHWTDFSIPSQRAYLHMPFPVISNRATCAYFLSWFQALRVDIRFTLAIKPDHKNSYSKLVCIAKAYNAKPLIPEFEAIQNDVLQYPNKCPEEWSLLAKRTIGLLSASALNLAAKNELTEEKRAELIEVGIEDMFEPVNIRAEINPILPWLTPDDLEPPIPKI